MSNKNTQNASVPPRDRLKFSGGLIAQRWITLKEIGAGGFAQIFAAEDIYTGKEIVLKVEPEAEYGDLRSDEEGFISEVLVYLAIADLNPFPSGFLRIDEGDYGISEGFNYIAMERLGDSLIDLLAKKNAEPSDYFLFSHGIQAINRLEQLHSLGYVHCDIKPQNLMVGKQDPHRLYLIDFGNSREFEDGNGNHLPARKGSFRGTANYASINVHLGWEPSRRDDLISLGYSMVFLRDLSLKLQDDHEITNEQARADINCEVPTRHLLDHDAQVWKEPDCFADGLAAIEQACPNLPSNHVARIKEGTSISEFCRGFPEMEKFLNCVLTLNFEDEPDHEYLRELLITGLSDGDIRPMSIEEW